MRFRDWMFIVLAIGLFFSTIALGEPEQYRGNCTYIGGLLATEKMIDLTDRTVTEKIPLVAEYGYRLKWLDVTNHGKTVESIVYYGDTHLAPDMRNSTKKDIYVITSAGGPEFLYQLLVRKVPCEAMICFVETTNTGLPWIVDIGMNIGALITGDERVDTDSDYIRSLYPDGPVMQAIQRNMTGFKPDVQVTGQYYEWFKLANVGPWDVFGAGSTFKTFPEPTPLAFPTVLHEKLLQNDSVIEGMFKALNISKLNASSNFLISQHPQVLPAGVLVKIFF